MVIRTIFRCQNLEVIRQAKNKSRIFLSPPDIGGTVEARLKEVFSENWIAPDGPPIFRFEEKLEQFLNSDKRVVALNSGTAAIHLGLKLLGVGSGDSVITPTFSFCASANPIIYLDADPVFIDCDETTWGLDPRLVREAIENESKIGRKPKAIVLVHAYGMPADVGAIRKISDDHDIPILEDAAEAMGSVYQGKKSGALGHLGVISFNGNKVLTTGGGGALIVEGDDDYQKVLKWSTQAKDRKPYYHHTELGYNYRMSSVAAAIGLGQLEDLQKRLERRREIFSEYCHYLDTEGVTFLQDGEMNSSNRWLTTLLIDPNKITASVDTIIDRLENENIEARRLWQPLHMQPLYEKYPRYISGYAEGLFKIGLCLPSGSHMQSEEVARVSEVILECIRD